MGIKLIDKINAEQMAGLAEKKYPEFRAGDIVRVSIKIKEGNFKLDLERVDYWLKNGAKPSTTVASLIRRAKNPNLKPHHAVKAQPKAEAKPAEA